MFSFGSVRAVQFLCHATLQATISARDSRLQNYPVPLCPEAPEKRPLSSASSPIIVPRHVVRRARIPWWCVPCPCHVCPIAVARPVGRGWPFGVCVKSSSGMSVRVRPVRRVVPYSGHACPIVVVRAVVRRAPSSGVVVQRHIGWVAGGRCRIFMSVPV